MKPKKRAPGAFFLLAAAACLVVSLQSAPPDAATSAATFFASRLPRGLPVPFVPPDNPISEEKVQLGRRLFYDTRLSGNGSYSCSSCHQQAKAFTDGRAQAIGSTGESHTRSALSLTNVAYNASLGWADYRRTLEAQMEVPMYNEHPIELGLKDRDLEVLARFAQPQDVDRFRAAFPDEDPPVTMPHIVKAVASFERVLLSGNSPFDRYLYQDDRSAMTPEALRGSALFFSSRLRCSECHGSFNLSGPVVYQGGRPAFGMFHNTGLYTLDLGLFIQTQRQSDMGQFRAPTLRNIAVTAPYMHDGSIPTLQNVVEHYARGGSPGPFKSDVIRGFQISQSEIDDLIAFLQSLTDEEFLTNPALSDPHIK
jgi:cytochrome c peroxidase